MQPNFSDILLARFTNISGLACLVELRLRLVADLRPSTRKFAHSKSIEDLHNAVVTEHGELMGTQRAEVLQTSRTLRNKIVHSDFFAASAKADQAAPGEITEHEVIKADLSGATNPRFVSETTRREAGVFGWLLECESNGTFEAAEKIFSQANVILAELTDQLSRESV